MLSIHYELIFHFITFKDMMNLRQVCKEARDTYNHPHFWYVVNLTDIVTTFNGIHNRFFCKSILIIVTCEHDYTY